MKGQRKNQNLSISQLNERALIVIVADGLSQRPRTRRECFVQFGGHRNDLGLPVIDRDSNQVFTIAKALHQSLQCLVRAGSPSLLDVPGQTLSENLGPSLQVTAERAAFGNHLVIRKAKRNQGYADNQGNNQPNTQQPHAWTSCSKFCNVPINRRSQIDKTRSKKQDRRNKEIGEAKIDEELARARWQRG